MGKGDRKTAKGKRSISSYGNVRSSVTKATGAVAAPVVKKTATSKTVAKAPAKKVAKKAVAAKE